MGTPCSLTFTDLCGYTDYGYGVRDCNNACSSVVWPAPQLASQCTSNECPAGFTGTPPNCTRNTCPTGTTGTFPNCTVTTPQPVGADQISIDAKPSIVVQGTRTTITWSGANVSNCTVSADKNDDSWSGTSDRRLSSEIVTKTTYTVRCTNADGDTVSDTAVVYIVPSWQER
ncbi:MAG: hypothetical protein D6800_04325 [Candidatus Zixiibacteriota bacterium]|nr:MAG: hypothetical protein D6800_04325 [candidate division Zixibacteria bacterium]